jgi:hypothetical protein
VHWQLHFSAPLAAQHVAPLPNPQLWHCALLVHVHE